MLRWVVHKQVNVVVFAIHLDQFRLEVNTNFREDDTKPIDGVSVKYPISILCYEDQMDVKLKYTVSTGIVGIVKWQRRLFKFRLYPNRQQQERLTATLEVCRELYNAGLQERIEAWKWPYDNGLNSYSGVVLLYVEHDEVSLALLCSIDDSQYE